MAAIGQVVVNAAALDYAAAILVAMVDGLRDQQCEDRAVAIVKTSGGAMRTLRRATCAQLRMQGVSEEAQHPYGSRTTEKDVQDDLKRWVREHPAACGPDCAVVPAAGGRAVVVTRPSVLPRGPGVSQVSPDRAAMTVNDPVYAAIHNEPETDGPSDYERPKPTDPGGTVNGVGKTKDYPVVRYQPSGGYGVDSHVWNQI